jgi:hypothetical protein
MKTQTFFEHDCEVHSVTWDDKAVELCINKSDDTITLFMSTFAGDEASLTMTAGEFKEALNFFKNKI